ncbi:MAG TPA: dCTP deaminase [Casimicrobiaceae bacterium]|nr:dCTP deaminase [Casimicrobiaceae bacterium]
MSIKSDKWIRRMAASHKMIEPFEPGQVREANGHKIVSYGTSSYGYDIRCSNEFKIFTNINSTIVDPKAFDAGSFVDFRGDICIIPPNSFALARTVEYFRIPRNVLVCTLGKSTYARCFRGDTRVALFDGTSPTLEEMTRRADSGEIFFGYSIDNGRVIVSLLDAPRFIGRDALLEIELDGGAVIAATPDHDFMLRDGRMLQAGSLRPGQSLMPLYREHVRGYEMVYQPINGHLDPTRRLADEWNVRNGIHTRETATHRHHRDFSLREYGAAIPDALATLAADLAGKRKNSEVDAPVRNHEVVAVRELPGDHDVYCLTVPEAGNFALEAGVFVRNCGIIVNVTPLEPEWEGHVTLEFSNTTPLPAKIYANEGVAQVIFFESDEVCETSYKDRGGKYQGQQGVTLPKI